VFNLWHGPFKSHISVMARTLQFTRLYGTAFSFSYKNYIHLMGQCYPVHPIKVKSNQYHAMNTWGCVSIKSPYIINCGTVWKRKVSSFFNLFTSGCFTQCLWSKPHSHMSMLHNDCKCEFKSCQAWRAW
jgi:hypothetical protein